MYTQQMATVFSAHVKAVVACLRQTFGLKYNEYTLLLAMYEAGIPVLVEPMADYLMLSRKALWSVMLSLEDQGYLVKKPSNHDGRTMMCILTNQGTSVVARAETSVNLSLRNIFMEALPEREWKVFRSSIVRANNAIRGHEPSETPEHLARTVRFCSDYLTYWRVCLDEMNRIARVRSLSFNEFRILLLVHESGTVGSAEIAKRLAIKPSGVSIYKDTLARRNLLLEATDPFDARRNVLRATAHGRKLALLILDDLNEFVRLAHSGLDAQGVAAVNAWYMRMYSNLQKNSA